MIKTRVRRGNELWLLNWMMMMIISMVSMKRRVGLCGTGGRKKVNFQLMTIKQLITNWVEHNKQKGRLALCNWCSFQMYFLFCFVFCHIHVVG